MVLHLLSGTIIPSDHMATSSIPGFITKTQAAQRYKRDFRNIGKDMAVAFAMRDNELLRHLKLRTKDGEIREGTDVTPDKVVQLQKEGMLPTWYLDTIHFDSKYKYRRDNDDARADDDVPYQSRPLPIEDADIVGSDDDVAGGIALLTHPMILMQAKRIDDLEKDHTSDREVIATLRETLSLLNKHVKKEPVRPKGRRSDDITDKEDGKREATKPKQTTKTTQQSATHNSRKSSAPTTASAEKKLLKDNVKVQGKNAQNKKWYNTPISELLSR